MSVSPITQRLLIVEFTDFCGVLYENGIEKINILNILNLDMMDIHVSFKETDITKTERTPWYKIHDSS